MKRATFIFACLFVFLLNFSAFIRAENHYQYIHDPRTAVYFGHISYTEVKHDGKDPFVLREGKTAPEVAVLNFPIAPGDIITTTDSRRCEIQFDTGTIVRLDTNTELKVETILAQSLSSHFKLTNLVLNRGQVYVMYKQYNPPEVFQILSSNASAKLRHNTVMMMRANPDGGTDLRVDSGQASVLYGPDESRVEQVSVRKSRDVNISPQNKIHSVEYKKAVEFVLWNEDMNENFMAIHEGVSTLPKPVQRLSPAVFYFAQMYANLYGEWVWNDIYGYVWRPFTNDRYPSGDWQPYYYGHWREINGTLFWIPEESWGWVPYHLGIWVWDKKHGWLWIPGNAFAPAWAAWNFYRGFFAWRPWSVWDWYSVGTYSHNYFWTPYYAYFGTQDYDSLTGPNPPPGDTPTKTPVLSKINKNQLKKKESVPFRPPKSMRKVLSNLAAAITKGDTRILDSMKAIPNPMVIVGENEINAVRLQALTKEFSQLDNTLQIGLMVVNRPLEAAHMAAKAFRRSEIITTLGKNLVIIRPDNAVDRTTGREGALSSGGSAESLSSRFESPAQTSRAAVRFRDWNPDIQEAIRSGVTISYSAKHNMVQCPELNLSSYNVNVRAGTSPQGGFFQASSAASSVSNASRSGSSSSSSAGSVSRGSASTSSSGSRSSSSSSSGSKGSVVKK